MDDLIQFVGQMIEDARAHDSEYRGGSSTGICSFSKIEGENAFGVELNDGTEFFLTIEEA